MTSACENFLVAGMTGYATEMEIKVMSIFHANGYMGLIYKWIRRNMEEDIESVVETFISSIYKTIHSPAYTANVESRYNHLPTK